MIKLCFNLSAVLHWRREYFEDFIEGSKSFGENFAVDFVEDFVKDLFQRCREAIDQKKLTRRTMLLAVGRHRTQVTGHCFTNTESILNIHKG